MLVPNDAVISSPWRLAIIDDLKNHKHKAKWALDDQWAIVKLADGSFSGTTFTRERQLTQHLFKSICF